MTEYVILRLDTGRPRAMTDEHPLQAYEKLEQTVKSSSPKRALAAADVGNGVFVAVPARSWKPLTVTVEQTTKVTII